MVHYTDSYLLAPPHQVTIDLVGLGGSGSQMLNGLARINAALIGLGHPGIHVRSWDNDIVTTANMGRQLFCVSDMGMNKATVLTTRVNRFYGYEWQAMSERYDYKQTSNILITCVDSAKERLALSERITKITKSQPTERSIYWMDLGNNLKTGQVVLGTISTVKQPKSNDRTCGSLKTVTQKFPELKKINEKDQGPSCSLAEALKKQDLFINSTLAQFGCNLIWKLFREGLIRYHGCYVNLDSFIVNPIKIK